MAIKVKIVSRSKIPAGMGGSMVGTGSLDNPFLDMININERIQDVASGFDDIRYGSLPDTVMDEINDIILEEIRDRTKDGYDVNGLPFAGIGPEYADYKSNTLGMDPIANLYAGANRFGPALDNMKLYRRGRTNRVEASFANSRQYDYMATHQNGSYKMPQRKFFPDGDDFDGGGYSDVRKQIDEIITSYFNDLVERRMSGQK